MAQSATDEERRKAVERLEADIAALRASDNPRAKGIADELQAKLDRAREALELEWLRDINRPVVIDDGNWRDKLRVVQMLPRWAHEPGPLARAWFDHVRAEGPPVILEAETLTEVREHLATDFIAFLWHCAYYKDRNTRKRMRAELTPGQLIVAWRLQAMIDACVPVRIIYLKVRQMGSSWLFANFDFWFMGFRENIGELVVANEEDSTRQVFSYLRDAWEALPDALRPAHEHSNKTELVLREKQKERLKGNLGLDSRATVATAANDLVGTGFPTQLCHGSEVGKWHLVANTGTLVTSITGGIQHEPWTAIVWESTAHGAGTFFHDECKAAMKQGTGEPGWNGFTFVFLPWYIDPRNVAKAPPDMELGAADDDEYGNEVLLKKRFNLSNEQLEWRRTKIRAFPSDVRSKVDLFRQEFPSTPAEAWLHAKGKAFPVDLTDALAERVLEENLQPIFVGDMQHNRSAGPALGYLREGQRSNEWLSVRPGGALRIFRLPDPRQDYIIGGDVAFGLMGGDHSCAKVYQRVGYPEEGRRPLRLAAELYGLFDDDVFAHCLWRLGWFYSSGWGKARTPAFLAWESSGPGANIAKWLRRGEHPESNDPYPTHRMFRRLRANSVKQRADSLFGIATTGQVKPILIGEWTKAARENEVQITQDDLDEAMTLERDDRDRIDTNARDRFMAMCMAVYAAQSTPVFMPTEEKREAEPPRHTGAWARRMREKRLADEAMLSEYEQIITLDEE